ncbi:MAG TPA: cupin domain-containing protein [Kofleriaceae bacterium]|nr:cupin domain-containing protein [Kofleriaceae bacterium]
MRRPRRGLLLSLCLAAACGGGGRGAPGPTAAGEKRGGQEADDASAAAAAAVERAVNQHNAAIHECWAMAAADDFHLEGEVVLAVTVGAGGAADKVQVLRDTTRDQVLVDCLKQLWAAHRWPPDVFGAEDVVQLPPFRFGAPDAQHTVSSRHVPKRPLGADGAAAASVAQVLLHPDNTGNGAAALSLLELAPGMAVPRHRHGSAELLLVLSGSGVMSGKRLRAGDGVYIAAGTPHELVNDGSEPVVAVQLYAPAGPERRFLGGSDPGTQPVPASERSRAAVRVASAAKARAYDILGGKGRAQIVFDAASARDDAASLIALTLDAGAEVPSHTHDGSSEYLYLIEGSGVMSIDGETTPVAAGDAIQIPSGIEHSFRATGGAAVKAVQFYAPAGPEQRFKAQAEKK